MKNTLVTLFLSFLLTGCSHQNAFTKFNMPAAEEKAFASQQDTSIIQKKEVAGAFSAVYLNEVSPDLYNEKEYFLVSIYLKDNQALDTLKNYEQVQQETTKGVFVLLNHTYPLTIEPLPQELQKYISLNADWNNYYLVVFEESRENTMRISLSGDGFQTKSLLYYKNEE